MSDEITFLSWTGVINPRTLAELISGERIDWSRLPDPNGRAAELIGISKRALFDPLSRAPHFALVDIARRRKEVNLSLEHLEKGIKQLATGREFLSSIGVEISPLASERAISVLARLGATRLFRREFDPTLYSWGDLGSFFSEASEAEDPIQGGLGDCYLIAALSAVAWAYPSAISHRTRRTGHRQQEFVDLFTFHEEGAHTVEVSERVPLTSTASPMFATSSEAKEIWPSLVEKAYAKWRTNDTDDEPDYYAIEGGWPEIACTHLVARHKAETVVHAAVTPGDVWAFISKHVRNRKTIHPVVASTYTDGRDKYTDKNNIVGRHAYTILGVETVDEQHYVVLRNPWGSTEATIDIISGVWSSWDASYLRGIPLNQAGVFAIKLETFWTYFYSTGVAVPF